MIGSSVTLRGKHWHFFLPKHVLYILADTVPSNLNPAGATVNTLTHVLSQKGSKHSADIPPSWEWDTRARETPGTSWFILWAGRSVTNQRLQREKALNEQPGGQWRGHRPEPTSPASLPCPGLLGVPEWCKIMCDFSFFKCARWHIWINKKKQNCKSCSAKIHSFQVSNWVAATQASPQFLLLCHSVWGPLPPNTRCWFRPSPGTGGRVMGTEGAVLHRLRHGQAQDSTYVRY